MGDKPEYIGHGTRTGERAGSFAPVLGLDNPGRMRYNADNMQKDCDGKKALQPVFREPAGGVSRHTVRRVYWSLSLLAQRRRDGRGLVGLGRVRRYTHGFPCWKL